VRVGGEGLVCPFETRRIGRVVRIEADMGGVASDFLACHPVADHRQLGFAIAILALDPGGEAIAVQGGARGNNLGAEQLPKVRDIETIGSACDDDSITIRTVCFDPVERPAENVACKRPSGKPGRNSRKRAPVDAPAKHQAKVDFLELRAVEQFQAVRKDGHDKGWSQHHPPRTVTRDGIGEERPEGRLSRDCPVHIVNCDALHDFAIMALQLARKQ